MSRGGRFACRRTPPRARRACVLTRVRPRTPGFPPARGRRPCRGRATTSTAHSDEWAGGRGQWVVAVDRRRTHGGKTCTSVESLTGRKRTAPTAAPQPWNLHAALARRLRGPIRRGKTRRKILVHGLLHRFAPLRESGGKKGDRFRPRAPPGSSGSREFSSQTARSPPRGRAAAPACCACPRRTSASRRPARQCG